MCCRCCTTLKVAATWGASIQIGVGLLLLLRYFLVVEPLEDYTIPYLVYIGLLSSEGVFILLAVQREVEWLLKGAIYVFILTQIFGFGIRLLIPAEVYSWTIIQRISALFTGILLTAIYSAVLILYSRKLAKSNLTDTPATASATAVAGSSRSAIEDPPPPSLTKV